MTAAKVSIRIAGLATLIVLAGCRTLPERAEQAGPLALLPPEQSAYALLLPPLVPGFVSSLSDAAPTDGERELLRSLLHRSEELAFSIGRDGSVAFAARGDYPRGSLRWSLRRQQPWERVTATAAGSEIDYWRNGAAGMELVVPSRKLLLGAFGGRSGESAQRLLEPPAGATIPPEAVAAIRSSGFGFYTAEPRALLERRAAGAGTAGPATEPQARLAEALRALMQSGMMDSLDSLLVLTSPGTGEGTLSTSLELSFESESAARISLVVLRLSLPNLLRELQTLGLVPPEQAPSEGLPDVVREGTLIRIGPIELERASLAERTLPLFSPLR